MEIIGKQISQIGAHLGGLTGSQKLALLLCVLLLVVGGAWLFQWSGQPDYIPLLDQAMKPGEVSAIESQLTATGQKFRSTGQQILVPADDRTRVQGMVAQMGLLPSDTSIGFAKLIEESNMWIPREESRWQRKVALGNELAKVIGHFDGVTEARVFIDSPERRGFGEPSATPTASVFLRTRAGFTLDKSRVAAIASLVSGAVHGLKPDAVRIVDATTGRPYRVPQEADAMPYDMMDLRRQKEDHFGRKIYAQLSYIPGVLVGVNVDLDTDRRHERKEKFGPPVPSEEESSSTETQSKSVAGSPGVRANTRAPAAAPGTTESSTTEESRTSLLGERDKTITETDMMPGVIRSVSASVSVPRSYFVTIFRQLNPGKEPQEKDLDPIIANEEKKIRAQVKPLIAATSDAQVEVAWFFDSPATTQPAAAADEPSRPMGMAAMVQDYGKQAALGVLALFSLLMVARMARRAPLGAAPTATAPEPAPAVRRGAASAGSDNGARAAAAPRDVVLPEPEIDEAVARVDAMVNEIDKMVGNEPDVAVSILDRWMSQAR